MKVEDRRVVRRLRHGALSSAVPAFRRYAFIVYAGALSLAFAGAAPYFGAMRTDVLAAMVAFCFVSGVTPGPNNLMLMTSGVNFGFRRTLPHLMASSSATP